MKIPEEHQEEFLLDFNLGNGRIEELREIAGVFLKDRMEREAGKIAPDTIGVDFFFVDGFMTEEMHWDFPYIVQDFIRHCYGRLPEFNEVVWYPNHASKYEKPEIALHGKMIGLIYNGAKLGDEYCVALIKYLHKLYHKKEYNQLKRFRKISMMEVFALAENDGERDYTVLGRVLGMCTFYGIEMDRTCSILYLLLNRIKEKCDRNDEEMVAFKDFEPGVFEECSRQVDEWYEKEKREKRQAGQFKKYWNIDKFVGFCLRHWGYPEDYVEQCMDNNMGIRVQFARTYAVLKSAYPSKEFTFEDVQFYTPLYSALAALVDVSDQYDMDTDSLLGVDGADFEEEEDVLFKPENLPFKPSAAKEPAEKKTEVNIAPVSMEEAGIEDYLEEIVTLRKRLNEKEQENQHLREMYRTAKMAKDEATELLKKYEGDREELIALREFAYKSAMEEDAIAPASLEEMKAAIRDLKLVIIGGHVNWINKLKAQFPFWTFIPPTAYRSVDGKMLERKDRIYFFTDYISHAAYEKFIGIAREKGLLFGYLGSVNLDSIVRLIYEETRQ